MACDRCGEACDRNLASLNAVNSGIAEGNGYLRLIVDNTQRIVEAVVVASEQTAVLNELAADFDTIAKSERRVSA